MLQLRNDYNIFEPAESKTRTYHWPFWSARRMVGGEERGRAEQDANRTGGPEAICPFSLSGFGEQPLCTSFCKNETEETLCKPKAEHHPHLIMGL